MIFLPQGSPEGLPFGSSDKNVIISVFAKNRPPLKSNSSTISSNTTF